jgi:hypothetical protein
MFRVCVDQPDGSSYYAFRESKNAFRFAEEALTAGGRLEATSVTVEEE